MDFQLSDAEAMETFNGDPFNSLLDDDIPQDIFDDIMNDLYSGNSNMNSLSSEDSGRSSSSFDDTFAQSDSMWNQSTPNLPPTIKMEPDQSNIVSQSNSNAHTIVTQNMPLTNAQSIFVQTTPIVPKHSLSSSQLLVSQPQNILIKQEPRQSIFVKQESPSNTQQIVTLQNIGGNLYMTGAPVDQTPVHTIVNGSTGIITKIPIVPLPRIISQPTNVTRNSAVSVATPKVTLPSLNTTAQRSSMKETKKTGHNIIERRYRTSIVSEIIVSLIYVYIILNFVKYINMCFYFCCCIFSINRTIR